MSVTFTPEEIVQCFVLYINGEYLDERSIAVCEKISSVVGPERFEAMIQILQKVSTDTADLKHGFAMKIAQKSIEVYRAGLQAGHQHTAEVAEQATTEGNNVVLFTRKSM